MDNPTTTHTTRMNLGNGRHTSEEIIASGIVYIGKPPAPTKCKFCGKTLYYEGLVFGGRCVCWNLSNPQRCDCRQAVEYWKIQDAKAVQQKALQEAQQKETAEQARLMAGLKAAGIKKRYADVSFDSYVVTPEKQKAFEAVKHYADHFKQVRNSGKILYIKGPYGTGKTHLAISVARVLIQNGYSVICKSAVDIFTDIKKTYDCSPLAEWEVLERYKTVDLLIIDDLGKENCTGWSVAALFDILNARYDDMLPFIITTNYSISELKAKETVGDCDDKNICAIFSRISENGEIVSMNFADYRNTKK